MIPDKDDIGVRTAALLNELEERGYIPKHWWAQSMHIPRKDSISGVVERHLSEFADWVVEEYHSKDDKPGGEE